MNETKKLGIGYTIFEFEEGKKRPVTMVKVRPGNFFQELKHLEERMKRQNKNIKLLSLCGGAFVYGYFIRTILAI